MFRKCLLKYPIISGIADIISVSFLRVMRSIGSKSFQEVYTFFKGIILLISIISITGGTIIFRRHFS